MNPMNDRVKRKTKYLIVGSAALILVWFAWPARYPFRCDYSRVVFDTHGELLRTTLAPDEQLRFEPSGIAVPDKYREAVLLYEDRRFFSHPGIDPIAIAGAVRTNLTSGRRVRGASTITMQVARMARGRPRTYWSKVLESMEALRFSLHFSKDEILTMYSAHVPMGGNIQGIESASWRYFGKPLKQITWAEAALFAVIPNSPSHMNIGRRREQLVAKRNGLLQTMMNRGVIDSLTFTLATAEHLPDDGSMLPFKAPHFTNYALRSTKGNRLKTTLDYSVQTRIDALVQNHHSILQNQGIRNIAVLVSQTETGAVRGYIGSHSFFDSAASGQVDGIQARRSTGSLLKPFLAAGAIDKGPYGMESILHDVPTFFGTFSPQNASREFLGLTTVDEMLVRSLNVPAVRLLNYYGLENFYDLLVGAGLKGLFRTPQGYGLSLILGGSEASMWELCAMYMTLANGGRLSAPRLSETVSSGSEGEQVYSRGASYLVLETLRKVRRPGADYYWHLFADNTPVAWKTGTSYGQKDGWAIGVSPQWTIGVWAGNFDGEGNAMLGGAQSAGPLLFTLFNELSRGERGEWFEIPEIDLKQKKVCAVSGFTPNQHCPESDNVMVPLNAHAERSCPVHKSKCVSSSEGWEVCSRCWDPADTLWRVFEVYDPAVIEVFRSTGRAFDTIPGHNPQCKAVRTAEAITIEYPPAGVAVQIPRSIQGDYERLILRASSSRANAPLFWYLNGTFIGETTSEHRIAVHLESGDYHLVIQTETGNSAEVVFRAFRR